jgi:hypothetical protein
MIKYKTFKNIVILSFFLLFFISCIGSNNSKSIKTGSVEYSIVWNTSKANSLPSNMRLLYSDMGYCLEFEKMFSFVGMRFSQKYKKDSLNFLLDMGAMGTYVEFPLADIRTNLKNLKIKKLSESKTILDYKCKVVQYSASGETFSMKVYYAEKLKIDVVNRIFPVLMIKGAILGIEILNKDSRVYIEATQISEQNVDSDLFIVPSDYIENSYEQVLSLIDGFVK